MASFNSGKNIFVVIQLKKAKKESVLPLLEKDASSIFGRGRYAYILHDQDKESDGTTKTEHLHIFLTADVAKSSQNWVKHFSDLLKVEPDAVSVEMQQSQKKCLRYLLHLDDGNKHQYDRSQVVTNCDDLCKKAWEASTGFVLNPTLEQLKEASSLGYQGIYNLVGMANFDRACRVLEKIGKENDLVEGTLEEMRDLLNALYQMTAEPAFLVKGYIPLKDFQKRLEEASKRFEDEIELRHRILRRTKK